MYLSDKNFQGFNLSIFSSEREYFIMMSAILKVHILKWTVCLGLAMLCQWETLIIVF